MSPANKKYLCIAAVLALLSVLLGAFGAHALKGSLNAYQIGIYGTAVQYQMFHSVALLISVVLSEQAELSFLQYRLKWAQRFFVAGTVVFSGSLYFLAVTGVKWLGAITPIGGLAFLLGWLCVLWFALGVTSNGLHEVHKNDAGSE
jgi:uncharacterized membrane protein YgdD (TMEM256/DUF423 family)